MALGLAARGVRAGVVRLSPSVHDKGDHGFVPMLINLAREKGVSAYIGDGVNRWPGVHRLDAARLYRLALEKGLAGTRYHGVADEGVPTRAIAEVIGRRLHLPVQSVSGEAASGHFGWIGHFFSMDLAASSTLTQKSLGWHPAHPGLLEDLDQDHYFAS
jgi:nucleoside-diphosphate-sugar epimerase